MITGQTLRDAILSGANNIANQRTRVDELNVFPVPDGDTGTNMKHDHRRRPAPSWRPCPTAAPWPRPARPLPPPCCAAPAATSGVITSLLFRGFSKALKDKTEASLR